VQKGKNNRFGSRDDLFEEIELRRKAFFVLLEKERKKAMKLEEGSAEHLTYLMHGGYPFRSHFIQRGWWWTGSDSEGSPEDNELSV